MKIIKLISIWVLHSNMNTKQIHKQKKEKSMISYYKNEDIKGEHYQGKYNKQKHFDNINNEFNVEEVSPFSFNGDSKRENKITNNLIEFHYFNN